MSIRSEPGRRRSCLLALILFPLVLVVLAAFWFWLGGQRNDRLLSGKYDGEISRELQTRADPVAAALLRYQADTGSPPDKLEQLVPNYIKSLPDGYMGGRLVYDPRPYYGVPFFFGFRGNYSGIYFLHGWSLIYCPAAACQLSGSGSRRIDDTWMFVHSSAF